VTGATFTLHVGERVGLIGRNGQGKTTLLRLLAGLDHPDEGSIRYAKGTSVEFLTQDADLTSESALYEYALSARQDLIGLEGELRQLEQKLGALGEEGADDSEAHELVERYDDLRERYQRLGGYQREADATAVLYGLGFSERDLALTMEQLSGGQRVRAALGRLLLQSPDLLLLDEPTNHLDLEATEWLESFLGGYHTGGQSNTPGGLRRQLLDVRGQARAEEEEAARALWAPAGRGGETQGFHPQIQGRAALARGQGQRAPS